ncbi:DUF1329 domain-containing protein [Ahniella affigens]|uniref:DUF1329 domain-containing protein n=1 Tax=Ahniella affigens TaxID=2021234 RepID=A0A2P1PRH4_9GAMM|nr:DUF1329 domain-containing protein [Ahniella affigens]AVP97431.1 DUF1329 domain-containing protein [Ahniella affigens]
MFQTHRLILGLGLTAGVFGATAQETNLTPIGAEKRGNADGTIPPWTGGIQSFPAGYRVGDRHLDPFASDSVQYEITPANYGDYAKFLSAGQKAMFEKYKTFKMQVYPTRRSASFPPAVYEWAQQNTRCPPKSSQLVAGFPYPKPGNGKQALLNHLMKYEGVAVTRRNDQAAPTVTGSFTLIGLADRQFAPRWVAEDSSQVSEYRAEVAVSPARLAGNVLLVHEAFADVASSAGQAWVYNPGQRRVRKAPNVAYDNPGTASDGLRTNDMDNMLTGALDRFDYQLVGKQELFVNYNAYKAHSAGVRVSDLVKAGHLNPDLMRYELHRVWVVEAKLKSGMRHINSRRTYYLDEDSWQILAIDHYDAQGIIWRYSEAAALNYYDQPLLWTTLETHHDLKSSRYVVSGLDNQEKVNAYYNVESADNFSPEGLRNNLDWFTSRSPGGGGGSSPRRPKGCRAN